MWPQVLKVQLTEGSPKGTYLHALNHTETLAHVSDGLY